MWNIWMLLILDVNIDLWFELQLEFAIGSAAVKNSSMKTNDNSTVSYYNQIWEQGKAGDVNMWVDERENIDA